MTKVVLILIDDMGMEHCRPFYERFGETWTTPEVVTEVGSSKGIQDFADNGIIFHRCYSMPTCSHSRYCVEAGRYGFRLNPPIRNVVDPFVTTGGRPPLDGRLLAQTLREKAGIDESIYLGKWHLHDDSEEGARMGRHGPIRSGYKKWAGVRGNMSLAGDTYGSFDYENVPYGVVPTSSAESVDPYTTQWQSERMVSDFSDWIDEVGPGRDDPGTEWFATLGFALCHAPYSPKPDAGTFNATSYPDVDMLPPDGAATAPTAANFLAMCNAVDFHIQQILDKIETYDPNYLETTVIIASDNGSPGTWAQSPFVAALQKGTPYADGTNVPLMVRGPACAPRAAGTAPSESHALVHLCDIHPTILEMFGVDPTDSDLGPMDGVSFMPMLTNPGNRGGRQWAYRMIGPDLKSPTLSNDRALCDQGYDLVRIGAAEYFFDLVNDIHEASALTIATLTSEQAFAHNRLTLKLDEIDAISAVDGDLTALDPTVW